MTVATRYFVVAPEQIGSDKKVLKILYEVGEHDDALIDKDKPRMFYRKRGDRLALNVVYAIEVTDETKFALHTAKFVRRYTGEHALRWEVEQDAADVTQKSEKLRAKAETMSALRTAMEPLRRVYWSLPSNQCTAFEVLVVRMLRSKL